MKLYYSKSSPFARKVRLAAQVLGLDGKLELVLVDVFGDTAQFRNINPLIKIPALEMETGETLVNSPFICQYLASLKPGQNLYPQAPELWQALNFQAVADGGTDAAVLRRMESLRSPDKQDSKFNRRQNEKIENALEFCEDNLFRLSQQDLTIAEISVICFVDYVQFRFGHEHWDQKFPKLFSWVQGWNGRNSLAKETAP